MDGMIHSKFTTTPGEKNAKNGWRNLVITTLEHDAEIQTQSVVNEMLLNKLIVSAVIIG
jgi:hypothetical protein